MADTAILTPRNADPTMVVTKKPRNNRRALKQKNPSTNEANIMAQKLSEPSPGSAVSSSATEPLKENPQPRAAAKKAKQPKASKTKQTPETSDSFEKEMEEMQEMLQKLRIEKEKTEELLKEKDEILKAKEEELENKEKEQEKLQLELKKLQKIKEFKPTMSLPVVQSMQEKEKDKKKKGGPENKRPSTPYILWCKDQWNEVKKENPNAEFKEVSNILGAKWKNVTAEEKKPYEEKYLAEKEAYLQVIAKEKREAEAMKLLEEDQRQKVAMELYDQYLQFKQDAQKENKKNKNEKDPLKPKQPMSAFFLFSNERRAALLSENKNVLEVAKIAGEEWKNMTDKQKAPYEEMAKKNKEKYAQEMEAYKQMKDEEALNLKKEEEELLKLQKQEAMQLLKKKEKTENIIKMAKKNKEKYAQEMEAYKQMKDEEALNLKKEEEELLKLQKQEAMQLLKKKEKTENIIKKTKVNRQKKKQQNVDPNKPKKPASSFLLFSKEARKSLTEERPGINNSTLNALISVKWKELGQEEKDIWNAKAADAMEVYKKQLEEYKKSTASDH